VSHLDRLVASALDQMAARASRVPLADVKTRALAQPPPRGFLRALLQKGTPSTFASKGDVPRSGAAVIAEVKRASPSRGAIAPKLDPARLAAAYERGGAACISVLTDRANFGGSLDDLAAARAACSLPVLRKDFLVTPYQLWEARAHGADAVLLIAAALAPAQLHELRTLARELQLDVLLEIHDEREVGIARTAQPELVGINARNLKTLAVDPDTFARVAPLVKDVAPLVAESGVRSGADVRRLAQLGARAVLVGEALSSAPDPQSAVRALVQG
jgi:indole-3-glycerol phosphate synthase